MTDDPNASRLTPDSPTNARASALPGREERPGDVPPALGTEEADEINLLELANVLLKRWKLVVGVPLMAALVAATISLLLPKKFTATATFVPEAEAGESGLPGSLRGLASQFGIGIPGGGGSPAQFYADVMESRTLRDQILMAWFADPRAEEPGDSATLMDILEIQGDSEAESLEMGREVLDGTVSVGVDNKTNLVSISVQTRYRVLSARVANRFVEQLVRFNLETRQSNVKTRRQFIESRVAEAEIALRMTEEALQGFLEQNRQFRGAPQLEVQYERLQRQVALKQEMLITLSRQYEEARIQEVNDTPMITVVDRAVPPVLKSSPRRKLIVLVTFFLFGAIGLVWAFAGEAIENAQQQNKGDYRKFISHWKDLTQEIRSILLRRPTKKHI